MHCQLEVRNTYAELIKTCRLGMYVCSARFRIKPLPVGHGIMKVTESLNQAHCIATGLFTLGQLNY